MSAPPVHVLLAEDEEHLGAILEGFLQGRGHRVCRVADGRAALAALRSTGFDVALLDVMMPEMDGLDVLRALASLDDAPEAIVMTGNGTADVALTALRLGAYDYLPKPYRMAEVDLVVRRAAEKRRLRREVAALRTRLGAGPAGGAEFTRHPPLAEVIARAREAAGGVPIVIAGERGSGRGALARWLHAQSGRGDDAWREVRCSGHPTADEVALFGTDGQAADGALAAHEGVSVLVRDADRLAPATRARLRDRLAGRESPGGDAGSAARRYLTVGSPSAGPDALPGLVVALPPLRERAVDVRPLVEHLLRSSVRRGATAPAVLTDEACEWLERQPWPGNVAELRLVVELAALRANGAPLTRAVLERAAGPMPHHSLQPTTA